MPNTAKKTEQGTAKQNNLPQFSIKGLIEAGVHFGHKTMRWNPKMQPFIYGASNNIHIIDLQKTAPLLHNALKVVKEVAQKNGKILFVATKRQATQILADEIEKCGQYYVNYRWMGGMLTNWSTVSQSIKTLNVMQKQLDDENIELNKKERLHISRKVDKLEKALGGIKNMGGKPDLIVIIDTRREKIAVQEAKKLGIPIVAIVDTNCDPDGIDYIVPGNDDSVKSIRMYCELFSEAVISGISDSMRAYQKDDSAAKEVKLEAVADDSEEKSEKKASTTKQAEKSEDTGEDAATAKKAPAKKPATKKATVKKAPAKKATVAKEKAE